MTGPGIRKWNLERFWKNFSGFVLGARKGKQWKLKKKLLVNLAFRFLKIFSYNGCFWKIKILVSILYTSLHLCSCPGYDIIVILSTASFTVFSTTIKYVLIIFSSNVFSLTSFSFSVRSNFPLYRKNFFHTSTPTKHFSLKNISLWAKSKYCSVNKVPSAYSLNFV